MFLLHSLPLFASSPLALEKIVISKSPQAAKIYVVEDEYLKASPVKSIPEAISLLGIDTQSRSLNYGVQTDFSHRALNFEGLTIFLDGQPINDPQTGHHNSDIPLMLEDIKSISLDPLTGAIDIESSAPQESKNLLEFTAGQYQTGSGRLSIANKKENFGLRLSLQRHESEGFRKDTDFKIFNASLSSNFKFTQQEEAFFVLGYGEKEFGAYDFYTPNRGYPSKEWTKTLILNTGLKLTGENYTLKPGFLWRRHFDKFMLDKTQRRTTYLNHHQTDVYRGSLSVNLADSFFDSVYLDTAFQEQRINSTNLGRHERGCYNISVDIKEELTDRFSLNNKLSFDYFESFKNKFSGSIILSHLLDYHNRLSLGASYKIRTPTFTELFYEDPTTRGNPNLLPEEWLSYQLGYDYQQEGLEAGLAIFFRKEDNLINWVKKEQPENWQAKNLLQAHCFGAEANLKASFFAQFCAGLNYAYIDKRIKDSGWLYKYGPNYATHQFSSFFEFDLPLFSSLIELQYKKRPARNGWFLANLAVRRKVNKNAEIFCRMSNLFNVEYQDIEGIPSPGRWFETGVRLEW